MTVDSVLKTVGDNSYLECEFGNSSDCALANKILTTILKDRETETKSSKSIFQRLFNVICCRSAVPDEIKPRELFPTTVNKRQAKQVRKSVVYESEVHKHITDALNAFEAFRRKNQGFGKRKKVEEVRAAQGFTETQIVPFHLL